MFRFITKLILTMLLTLNVTATVAAAQDADNVDITSGIVTNITASSITLVDSDGEEELTVTVMINAETKYENIKSLDQVALGDEVYIDYVASPNGNMAVNIFKIGLSSDDDDDQNYMEDENYINDEEWKEETWDDSQSPEEIQNETQEQK